jgi:hypothetical protein
MVAACVRCKCGVVRLLMGCRRDYEKSHIPTTGAFRYGPTAESSNANVRFGAIKR